MYNYTDEKNILMLISLLKQNNVSRIIVNPGTMNMSFVASIQNDPFFTVYSCVDERSACYMACGMSVELNEPVVLTCTGATASRNYMPGLTEAFYRKIPILAITSSPHFSKVGHNIPQVINRTNEPLDIAKTSIQLPSIFCSDDEWNCNILLNKAFMNLIGPNKGPVHINLETIVTRNFDVKELPIYRKISKVYLEDKFPLPNGRVGIFIGNHRIIDNRLQDEIESFCEKFNAVVICDHTSNYFGMYKILANIVVDQDYYKATCNNFDVLIHIGDISGAYMNLNVKEVWRIDENGELKDTFRKLKYVFEMSEYSFFSKINSILKEEKKDTSFYREWELEIKFFKDRANKIELPLSNMWIARNVMELLPNNSTVHLAILNSLRSWNYFDNDKTKYIYSNTGGFGIDGMMSTLIGASLCNYSKLFFGIVGDLAFFYDLNSLGNRHIGNNLRIILINNGCGTEFHNYSHPANLLGNDMISMYIAADGHFGNKSKTLVKNYVENLGFEYISANSKDDFIKQINYFMNDKLSEKSIVFEIFTSSKDEDIALKTIRSLKTSQKENIKKIIKKIIPMKAKTRFKKIIGR